MTLCPEQPPLNERNLVENNLFAICEDDEPLTLWDALRVFYANGYIPENSPLKDYQQKYLHRHEPGLGLVVVNNPTQSSALDGAWERRSIH